MMPNSKLGMPYCTGICATDTLITSTGNHGNATTLPVYINIITQNASSAIQNVYTVTQNVYIVINLYFVIQNIYTVILCCACKHVHCITRYQYKVSTKYQYLIHKQVKECTGAKCRGHADRQTNTMLP